MNEPTRRPIAVADYVAVGTGSAGSVVAARLSADERNQVLVLEAGPKDNDRRIHMPVTWLQPFRSKFDWDYLAEPQPELNGRRIYWPRGKTLGGSSSLNAMMWVRGFAADYDEWARHAGHEWTFSRVVEYFTRIREIHNRRRAGTDGSARGGHLPEATLALGLWHADV
jgi:choline dehydrogenase